MSKKCVVCNREADWTKVKEAFESILDQADRYGVESLTEHQQVVYLGECCSPECYQALD